MRINIFNLILISGLLLLCNSNALALDKVSLKSPFVNGVHAQNETENNIQQIDVLTKQIILKIIELEKFNLHYRREVGKKGRWSGWRYAGLQEIQSCVNFGAGVFATGERTSHFHNPEGLSVGKIENCNLAAMTGSFIGASAAVLEFGITEFHDVQAKSHGFSPQKAKAYVLSIKRNLDSLIAERNALIKAELQSLAPNLQAEEHAAEGKVLLDLRDLALWEFEKFHIGGRRFVAFQKSLYLFDMAKYSCSAAGNLCAFMSQHRTDRRWNLPAGILLDTGGGLVIAAPFVSRGIGIVAQKIQKHYIAPIINDIKVVQTTTLKDDEAILEKISLKAAAGAETDNSLQRFFTYHKEKQIFESEFNNIINKDRAGKLTATQTMIAGTFVGSCDLAGGILYTSAGVIANGKMPRDARVTNYNIGTAAIIGIPANAVSILDTLRIQVQDEIRYHKAAKEGKLPRQLYAANLNRLDQIQQQLSNSN